MEVLEFSFMRSSGLSLCWQRRILRGCRPAVPNPCMYSFLPVVLNGGLVLPGRDCSATVDPWLHEQQPCRCWCHVWTIFECCDSPQKSFGGFHNCLHLDALLIRVQQVLLTRRTGNKGMLWAYSYNSHTGSNQRVLHNKYHFIWCLCVYVYKVTGCRVKTIPLLIVCYYL